MVSLNPDTRLLREGHEPVYRRLAECLLHRGVDPGASALAILFEDGPNDFGIVVTPSGDVFEFELHWGKGDISTAISTAEITRWDEVTDEWRDRPFSKDVAAAVAIVQREL